MDPHVAEVSPKAGLEKRACPRIQRAAAPCLESLVHHGRDRASGGTVRSRRVKRFAVQLVLFVPAGRAFPVNNWSGRPHDAVGHALGFVLGAVVGPADGQPAQIPLRALSGRCGASSARTSIGAALDQGANRAIAGRPLQLDDRPRVGGDQPRPLSRRRGSDA